MQKQILFSMASLALVLSGCASQPSSIESIRYQAGQQAMSTSQSGATLLGQAATLAGTAQSQETYRFAPSLTTEAAKALATAKANMSKGRSDSDIRTQALTAIATYQQALDQTLMAREVFAPALAHNEVLNSIAAAKFYPSDYLGIEKDLNKAIAKLEVTASPESVREDQADLLNRMHQLEVNVVGYNKLQYIRNQIDSMRQADAEKIIPRSFATAERALAEAEALIRLKPRAKDEIDSKSKDSQIASMHAQVMLSMSNEILEADVENVEALVLRTERWLYNISVALKHPDIRYLPMDEQSRRYAQAIEYLTQK